MANVKINNIEFSPALNTFYCECGGSMRWDGGRFAAPGHEHEMEVIRCSKCGHAIDPALVIEEAINALRDWHSRREAYFAAAAQLVAAVAEEAEENMSFFARFCNLWRAI